MKQRFYMILFYLFAKQNFGHTAPQTGENIGSKTLTFSIPDLGGGIQISGFLNEDSDENQPRKVEISLPSLSGGGGGLSNLFGSQVIDDLFGLPGDSDSSPGGVSLNFNFPSGQNLGNIFRQSNGIFQDNTPFGLNGFYLDDGPSLTDLNSFFSSSSRRQRPTTTPPPVLGKFSALTGGPWSNFKNIFSLYNMPEHAGYVEVFGPVYDDGQGCGLCHLFPHYGLGSFITLELVVTPFYADFQDFVEVLPGGFVGKVNNTCIQVLDEQGDGVYFLLNEEDPVGDDPIEDNTEEDNSPATEIIPVEPLPEYDEEVPPVIEYVDTSGGDIPEVDFIDEDVVDEDVVDEDEAATTTEIPLSVLDPSRFDIANDKISSSNTPITSPTTTETIANETIVTTIVPPTEEEVTEETNDEEEKTDPTLNIDPGLLEELKNKTE